ncbi:hypothetical protein M0812_06924 [Anaeramoeba flamelloides]|uniref:Uncharacterized protein n=1 Tax=Anaeramoeba flamelloides TaxID=1746091 RepID=A0AAV8AE35_9EUKA|nr:hypothetical protein M0812_06924 [Anaeramoeba flamelloides]
MGNQSKKSIKIPQPQITTYFQIFHQTKTAIMLLELKKLSMVDLNQSCRKLFGIEKNDSNFNQTPFDYCPSVQTMHQNKSSDTVFREQIGKLDGKKGLTEFYFDWKNTKGKNLRTLLSLRPINLWGNSLLQIMISDLKHETNNESNLAFRDYLLESNNTQEINNTDQEVQIISNWEDVELEK